MKFCLPVCLLTLGLAGSAFGSACSSLTTLQDYITAGSCTIAGLGQNYTLNNLTFVAVGVLANTATPGNIDVTTSISSTGPSVDFTPDSTMKIGGLLLETTAYVFGFDIESNISNIGFQSVNLSEQSALTGLASLGAVAEEDCYGGALPVVNVNLLSLGEGGIACTSGGLAVGASIALTPLTNTNANANLVFNGFTSTVDVLKEIDLTAAALGTAQVTGIGQTFTTETNGSAVPEPTTMFLGGCGLIALALLRPRRSKQS